MIPDTDEELIAEAKRCGADYDTSDASVGIFRDTILIATKELRALINHYIAKDRAQGMESHVYIDEFGNAEKTMQQWMINEPGVIWTPLYTHAQPIAEAQLFGIDFAAEYVRDKNAEALEKAADWHGESDWPEYLRSVAAKLRKGESL